MFLLNILEAVLAYDLVKIRFIKEKEAILNGITNDKSRGIQLIGTGYLQKVIKGVNWLLSPIVLVNQGNYLDLRKLLDRIGTFRLSRWTESEPSDCPDKLKTEKTFPHYTLEGLFRF